MSNAIVESLVFLKCNNDTCITYSRVNRHDRQIAMPVKGDRPIWTSYWQTVHERQRIDS